MDITANILIIVFGFLIHVGAITYTFLLLKNHDCKRCWIAFCFSFLLMMLRKGLLLKHIDWLNPSSPFAETEVVGLFGWFFLFIGLFYLYRWFNNRISYLEKLADEIPQICSVCDEKGLVIFVNKKWTEYTGQDVESCKGKGWEPFVHSDDLLSVKSLWESCILTGQPLNKECRILDKFGNSNSFLLKATPLKDDNGRIKRWFGIATDISDYQKDKKIFASRTV